MCKILTHVTVHTKSYPATREQPAEYEDRFICDECGKVVEDGFTSNTIVRDVHGRLFEDYEIDTLEKIETKSVVIPSCEAHQGFYGKMVTLEWICPVCGGPRGEVYPAKSYDGSAILFCDGWKNPCGHVDEYSAVRKEAESEAIEDDDDYGYSSQKNFD